MEFCYDTGEITKYEITDEGYLRAEAVIARIGVQTYYNADGSPRREFRPPEEVSNPDSLASFGWKAHTNEHPPRLLDKTNTKKYQTGTVDTTVKYDKGFVKVAIQVTDSQNIQDILSGKKQQISCGYTRDYDPTPGIWRGQKYDGIQRNIRGNHTSSVPRGRAGGDVKFLLDSADSWVSKPLKNKQIASILDDQIVVIDAKIMQTEDMTIEVGSDLEEERKKELEMEDMKSKKMDMSYKTEKAMDSRVDVLRRENQILIDGNDELQQKVIDLTNKELGYQSEIRNLKANLDSAKRSVIDSETRINDAVETEVSGRIKAWSEAKSYLPKSLADSYDPKMTRKEILKAAIQHQGITITAEDPTLDAIEMAFDTMKQSISRLTRNPVNTNRTSKLIGDSLNSNISVTDSSQVKKEAAKKEQEAWMITN